jgi:hypothetical protein
MRERLAFGAETIREALLALRQYVDEGFIISTCNRVEIGGLVADGPFWPTGTASRSITSRHICMYLLAPKRFSTCFAWRPGLIQPCSAKIR